MPNAVLSLNAGSSSLKFALFDADGLNSLVSGAIETDGSASRFRAKNGAGNLLADEEQPVSPHDAVTGLLDWIERHLGANTLVAAGHRVVHGGPHHHAPEIVTPALIAALEKLAPLAPLHQMHDLAPMRAITAARPRLPQIACFDTAFHRTIPPVAARFGLPRAYEADGIRRFGFHGLSYEYIAGKLTAVAPEVARKKVIVAHLGNGASLCAMENCRSIDTSMGMTPLDGLVMGTRCGTIDPGVILFLLRERNMTADAVEDLLYRRSGLLGVSGISSDMRTLQQSTDIRAAEAIDLFVFRVARDIAALAGSLQGVDALVFTAGIGEHAPDIRRRICERMAWLGLELNGDANSAGKFRITTPGSRVAGLVIPTNEEWMIAHHTQQVLKGVAGARS